MKTLESVNPFNKNKTYTVTYNTKTKMFKIVQKVKGFETATTETDSVYSVSEITYLEQSEVETLKVTGASNRDVRELIKVSHLAKELRYEIEEDSNILEFFYSLESSKEEFKKCRKYSDRYFLFKNKVIPYHKAEEKQYTLISRVQETMNIRQYDKLLDEGWLCPELFDVGYEDVENRY